MSLLSTLSLSGFLDLLKQSQPQKPIKAQYGDNALSFANCLLPNPSSVKSKKETAQAQTDTLVRGANFHCVVQSRMVVTGIVAGEENPVQDESAQEKSKDANSGIVIEDITRLWSTPMHLHGDLDLTSTLTITIEDQHQRKGGEGER